MKPDLRATQRELLALLEGGKPSPRERCGSCGHYADATSPGCEECAHGREPAE